MAKQSRKKLREILPFLQTVKELRPAHRAIILAHLDDSSCEALYEAVYNVLRNPRLSVSQRIQLKKVLQPHKACLRSLVNKKASTKTKRKKLYEVGGFPLTTILATAIPLLIDILRGKK